MKKLELTIDSNDRVFVVGDIHGEITVLNEKLFEIGFNKEPGYFLPFIHDPRPRTSLPPMEQLDESS